MNVEHAPTVVTESRERHSSARLHGRWLLLARGVWLVLVVLTPAIFFVSLPVYAAQLQTPCAGSTCQWQQLTPSQAEMLKGMGLSLADYAVVTLALALASVVMCLVVSTLIIWRGPDNRIALIVALMLVTLGPIIVVADPPAASPWWVPNACLTFLTGFLLVLVFLLFPSGQFVPHWMRWTLVVFLVGDTSSLPLFLPLSFGFAILRSRLWDIDVLINRTLVYGTLTVTLTAVYVGLVIGLQTLLRGLISQDNSVAIVLSTLVIAALFQPLRHGIQRSIDRRFYRRKYDSAKIVAAFSATLRNEVDLDLLREQLMTVVQETMQPSHFSLWLRPPEPSRKRQTWLLARNASRNIKF